MCDVLVKKMLKEKAAVIVCCVLALSIFCSAGIIAYFTDGDTVKNEFIIGGNTVDVIENFIPPEELEPGVVFTKDVKVSNTGPNDCFVRMSVVFSDEDIGKYCEVNYNTADWVLEQEDGYWYYKNPLASGAITTSLFTSVKVKDSAPLDAMKDFEVLVYTESYQSYDRVNQRPFTSYQDAWDMYEANKATKDHLGPAITLLSPVGATESSAAVVEGNSYTVKGVVSDQSGVASVRVNGVAVTVAEDGSWSTGIIISATATEIVVTATDNEGNISSYTGYVRCK